MKYLKTYKQKENFKIFDIEVDLKIELKYTKIYSPYNIDFICFCKEIFLNKYIEFKPLDKSEFVMELPTDKRFKKDSLIRGIVQDIGIFYYYDMFFIKFKIDNEWYLARNYSEITVYGLDDYYNKPLHKELKFKKELEKYNL